MNDSIIKREIYSNKNIIINLLNEKQIDNIIAVTFADGTNRKFEISDEGLDWLEKGLFVAQMGKNDRSVVENSEKNRKIRIIEFLKKINTQEENFADINFADDNFNDVNCFVRYFFTVFYGAFNKENNYNGISSEGSNDSFNHALDYSYNYALDYALYAWKNIFFMTNAERKYTPNGENPLLEYYCRSVGTGWRKEKIKKSETNFNNKQETVLVLH